MSDLQFALFPFLVVSAVAAWASAVILVVLARRRPRVAFLVERAVGAVILALSTTAYVVIAHNSDQDFVWFGADTGRVLVRLLFIALGFIPLIWLALYWRKSGPPEPPVDDGGDTPYPGSGDH